LPTAIREDSTGDTAFALWTAWQAAEAEWLSEPEILAMQDALTSVPELLGSIWGSHALSLLSYDVSVGVNRRLIRTGNFELSGEHFHWVNDDQVSQESHPEWALLFERLSWGRFYGFPESLVIDGQAVASEPAEVWAAFQRHHPEVRQRWQRRRRLETVQTGAINRQLEDARLQLRRIELRFGRDSAAWLEAERQLQDTQRELDAQFDAIREEIIALDQANEGYQLQVRTADGQEIALPLTGIVRAYPANRLSRLGRWQNVFSRGGPSS
jgi:phosphate transport system permease protein